MLNYDVVIIGGGTAGCSAAYNFSKLGMKTLVIEQSTFLGGLMTGGLVTPAMKSAENQINSEFFTEFKNIMGDGMITYCDNNSGWFNPEIAKIKLEKLLKDNNVDIFYNAEVIDYTKEDNIIKTINVKTRDISGKILSVPICSIYYVDATGFSDFCQIINCNFIDDYDEKSNKLTQPMNLRFTMGGVNVNTFGEWIYTLDKNREVTTLCTINGQTHLSTACTWDGEWALTPIFKKAVSDGVLTENDSNYFQLFTIPLMLDTIAFNAPRVVDLYDTTDIFAITKTLSTARESIYRLADFCKKYFPGFENSYISNIATHLGTRVSKRVAGKHIYTVEDLKSGKKFKNPVVVSNYPIDVHSADKNKSVLEKQYQEYCIASNLTPMSAGEFSKQVKKYYGFTIKDKKIQGKSKEFS